MLWSKAKLVKAVPADPVTRFIEIAARFPDAIAVEQDGARVSYAELVEMAARIAAACAAHGDHPRVLIHLPRGAPAYAAMFGGMMAGGYYAPMNLDHPVARQRKLLRHFQPDVVVGTQVTRATLALPDNVPLIDVADLPRAALGAPRHAHDLAYVMFTSGSTGEPKGVMIGRDSLAHYTAWALDTVAATPDDRWSQHPNIGFDLSVLDIYGALCAGATLVPLSGRRDQLFAGEAIRDKRLTIWNSVPSVIDLMRKGKQVTRDNLAALRLMTFCGEPLFREHLDAIFSARPDLTVHNTYGPTEATVSFTLLRLGAGNYTNACDRSVALGEAIAGMDCLLVDNGAICEDEGEIAIVGPQLARGYWNSPELAGAAFRTIHYQGREQRAYFTGDWAYRKNGHLFFGNRMDRQVKIRGNRFELGEIDSALRHCGARAACTVLVKGRLVSFIESDGALDLGAVLVHLREILPDYAVPAEIRPVAQLA